MIDQMAFLTIISVVESAPAGGAEVKQVVLGGAISSIWFTAIAFLGMRHRAGSSRALTRLGETARSFTGLPGWVALPIIISTVAFAIAGVGFVWDVALHIDRGRDAGPFANPSHYMLIAGTILLVSSGWLAIVMPIGREAGSSSIRLAETWWAPVGGIAMFICSIMALAGFVLDDLWHRIYGQDVTLWGPTHLMMISGGILVFFGSFALLHEGISALKDRAHQLGRKYQRPSRRTASVRLAFKVISAGGVISGLTLAYQQEFAYGVPQFRLLFHPVLIALTAGIGLVFARLAIGRGGAFVAMIATDVILGLLTLIAGPILGEVTHHFPLYAAEAVLVEFAALAFIKRGPVSFAMASGLLIGTIGVVAEWGWSQIWMPIGWPASILPTAILLSVVVGVAGAMIGVFIGETDPGAKNGKLFDRGFVAAPIAGLTVIALVLGGLLITTLPKNVFAHIELEEVTGAPSRTVNATVRFEPPGFADDPDWLQGFAWQGDQRARVAPLRAAGPGVWKTTEPIPVYGSWKSAIRFHRGMTMGTVPVYAPADAAIPVPEIPATASFSRRMTSNHKVMQRERREDVPSWLFSLGSGIVALMTTLAIFLVGWALLRAARSESQIKPPTRASGTPAAHDQVLSRA